MKRLIIVGAGGCGREVAEFALEMCTLNPYEWELVGFLDDDSNLAQEMLASYPVLGKVNGWKPSTNDVYLCSISNSKIRQEICSELELNGAQFISLIHPTVRVSPSAEIGKGTIIYPNSYVSTSAVIGDHVIINYCSGVGHDASISSYSTISAFCDITGNVKIGKRVFLGSHVTIAPGVKVGSDSYVALGSAVVANVTAGKKIMGVPARKLEL